MRVVIAPDSFKDCLPAWSVAEALARGVQRALPSAMIDQVPMADGGQGTIDALLRSVPGSRLSARVHGPRDESIDATFALLEGGVAVVEMAAASGLELVPPAERNPLITTTRGTGELMVAAMEAGARRILVAIGGSATNDGGAGMAQGLGYRLLDAKGESLPSGGGALDRLDRIDASSLHPKLKETIVEVACDVSNPLTGPTGASAVYGPQKGATPQMVETLDRNLAHLAHIVRRDLKVEMDGKGAGAAGGLGGGLVAFAGGKLRPGVEIVIEATRLAERLEGADLCLTGEGSLDGQTAFGKTAAGVAKLCQQLGVPAVALAGAVSGDLTAVHHLGLVACLSITPHPCSLDEAIISASANLERAAEQAVRLFLAGRKA